MHFQFKEIFTYNYGKTLGSLIQNVKMGLQARKDDINSKDGFNHFETVNPAQKSKLCDSGGLNNNSLGDLDSGGFNSNSSSVGSDLYHSLSTSAFSDTSLNSQLTVANTESDGSVTLSSQENSLNQYCSTNSLPLLSPTLDSCSNIKSYVPSFSKLSETGRKFLIENGCNISAKEFYPRQQMFVQDEFKGGFATSDSQLLENKRTSPENLPVFWLAEENNRFDDIVYQDLSQSLETSQTLFLQREETLPSANFTQRFSLCNEKNSSLLTTNFPQSWLTELPEFQPRLSSNSLKTSSTLQSALDNSSAQYLDQNFGQHFSEFFDENSTVYSNYEPIGASLDSQSYCEAGTGENSTFLGYLSVIFFFFIF